MWFIPILISIALSVISYLLMPKPKKQQPEATQDMDNPSPQAGTPVPVVFGTITVKGLNVLWFGNKNKWDYEVRS